MLLDAINVGTARSPATQAMFDEDRLIDMVWTFGAVGQAPRSTTFHFKRDGRIGGFRSPHERFWRLRDGALEILDQHGRLTWRFGAPEIQDGGLRLLGRHAVRPDSEGDHQLSETPRGAAWPEAGDAPAGQAAAGPPDDMVKLVIWDLDETFWTGTLAEGEITPIAAHLDLVRELSHRGIVNAICSKNDFARAREELVRLGVWDFFIFPRIAFAPKGAMIRDIVEAAQLRAQSVLFLDDNPMNLNEAAHYCPGLQVADPAAIPGLRTDRRLAGKPDPALTRLARYKVLEQKQADRAGAATDNLGFLRQSEIRISFHHDVMAEFPRIHDLVNRTNQLNFTKKRWPEDEAEARALFTAELERNFHSHAGYVKVADRYGSYGISGFYLIRAETCEHFLFSCRTLNMGIEQFVWQKLGRPALEIVGVVVATLGDSPNWITVVDDADRPSQSYGAIVRPTVCVRGACDLSMMTHYLRTRYDTVEEFPYPFQGWGVHPAASVITAAAEVETPAGAALIAKLPGIPPRRFDSAINTGAADVYVLSFSAEIMFGLYRSKSTGIVLPLEHRAVGNFDFAEIPFEALAGRGGAGITEAQWAFMREEFEFCGIADETLLKADVTRLLSKLTGKVVIVLMMNTEVGSAKATLRAFARVNSIVRPIAMEHGCHLIEMNEFVRSVDHLVKPTDGGVHYTREVYMKLARRISEIVSYAGGELRGPAPTQAPNSAPTRSARRAGLYSPEPTEEFQTDSLSVRFYRRDPRNLVIVFASAGAKRIGGYAQEYFGTLATLGVSVVFVTDRLIRWYNYADTADVFARIAAIADDFENVGTVGESMGGSGAILFTRFFPRVNRVLAIAPQFSVADPFVRFDQRYVGSAERIEHFYFPTYSETPILECCQIIYGNTSWRDYIHASMFRAAGHSISYVEGGPHELSRHLKSDTGGDNLLAIMTLFCDFKTPFNRTSLRSLTAVKWTEVELQAKHSFAEMAAAKIVLDDYRRHPLPLPVALQPLISKGKYATQSSISNWSKQRNVDADAAGALNGEITGNYNFHTAIEDEPWWKVDLGAVFAVSEIRIFNRVSSIAVARRAYRFDLLTSLDGDRWDIAVTKDDDVYFGGIDGRPFRFLATAPCQARWVKIRLKGRNCLHLDQVQVFGEPVDAAVE